MACAPEKSFDPTVSDLLWAEATPPAVTPTARVRRPAVRSAHERRRNRALFIGTSCRDGVEASVYPRPGRRNLSEWVGFRRVGLRASARSRGRCGRWPTPGP